MNFNHNRSARGVKVNASIKAGGLNLQHNGVRVRQSR